MVGVNQFRILSSQRLQRRSNIRASVFSSFSDKSMVFKYVVPSEKERFQQFHLEINQNLTDIITCLGNNENKLSIVNEENKLYAIRLNKKLLLNPLIKSEYLLIRQEFPQLLEQIRENKKSLLSGRPDVGKSFFQFYYLARILNPKLLDELPPDCFGSTKAPTVIIRQLGKTKLSFLLIQDNLAFDITNFSSMNLVNILDCFDVKNTLFWYEPGEEDSVEFSFEGIKTPTLATITKNENLKKIIKNEGKMTLMPGYSKDELDSIIEFLAGQHYLSKPSEDNIIKKENDNELNKEEKLDYLLNDIHEYIIDDLLEIGVTWHQRPYYFRALNNHELPWFEFPLKLKKSGKPAPLFKNMLKYTSYLYNLKIPTNLLKVSKTREYKCILFRVPFEPEDMLVCLILLRVDGNNEKIVDIDPIIEELEVPRTSVSFFVVPRPGKEDDIKVIQVSKYDMYDFCGILKIPPFYK